MVHTFEFNFHWLSSQTLLFLGGFFQCVYLLNITHFYMCINFNQDWDASIQLTVWLDSVCVFMMIKVIWIRVLLQHSWRSSMATTNPLQYSMRIDFWRGPWIWNIHIVICTNKPIFRVRDWIARKLFAWPGRFQSPKYLLRTMWTA